ncbi:hypothetical protein J6396_37675, partial [Pseudomonas aeruginosa]|nr:hypothetical protein [Pseudomonas aeruginosa]
CTYKGAGFSLDRVETNPDVCCAARRVAVSSKLTYRTPPNTSEMPIKERIAPITENGLAQQVLGQ